jgi:hypothetical protein
MDALKLYPAVLQLDRMTLMAAVDVLMTHRSQYHIELVLRSSTTSTTLIQAVKIGC